MSLLSRLRRSQQIILALFAVVITSGFLARTAGHFGQLGAYRAANGYGFATDVDGLPPSSSNTNDEGTVIPSFHIRTSCIEKYGAQFSAQHINAFMQSSAWKDGVFFLTYDEAGGLYDHVAEKNQGLSPAPLPITS